MLPIVCRRSTFRILPPIIVASALLMAVSTNTDRSAAQKSNKGILLVTSYGGPDVRGPDISPEIFAIHFDGSGRKPLLPKRTEAFDPDLSPDGKRIAFVASNGKEPRTDKHAWVLYVMKADGTGRKRLTESASTADRLLAPRWSADGKKIAFCTVGFGLGKTGPVMSSPPRICIIDADGGNLKRLDKLNGVDPAWSPDGKQLLFTRLGKDLEAGLYIADADGTNVRSLLKRNDYDMVTGAWSPDCKLLAYAIPSDDHPNRRDGPIEIGLFLAKADGSQPKRLAGGPKERPMASSGPRTASDCTSPVEIARDPCSTRRIRLKAATGAPAPCTRLMSMARTSGASPSAKSESTLAGMFCSGWEFSLNK